MSPVAIVLILLFVALVLFATEKIPVDVVGIILVICLVLTGVLTARQGVQGFGDDIIVTIAGLFVLTGGLVKTGIVDLVGRRLYRIAGDNELFLTALIMVVAAFSAAVLKNTTTTAMFVPVVIGLAAKAKIPPSKLLMPLAFGAILGGSTTLIGTSTNLAVSGAFQRYGYEPFSLFELTPVGIITAVFGLAYMLFIGRRFLPSRGGEEEFTKKYNIREYISEVLVLPSSKLVGKSLRESDVGAQFGLNVIGIIREGEEDEIIPEAEEIIQANDLLIVEGSIDQLLRVKEDASLKIKADFELNDDMLESGEVELFEVLVTKGSSLVGHTLATMQFKQTYDLTVLALNRAGETFFNKLSDVRLKFGDVLLVQGKLKRIDPFLEKNEILLLEDISASTIRTQKRKWAITAFAVFLGLSLSKLVTGIEVPLAIAVLIGVLVLLGSRTVKYSELYGLIDFRLLVMIACMMSFGVAMENTGTDQYLAGLVQSNFGQFGATAVLAGFFLLTVFLTQPMSNQAAALVVLPVAVKTALALGLNPRTFAIGITYAASFSFMTPLEPACVLVYTPGGYRFTDFVKIGVALTIVVFVVAILLVPIFWPIFGE
ncbi:MAG: SLC13 family permease [Acidobacteria bacterium]|nr:MAG: SLC13 family permease [Acidobacteriota bacterium]REK03989.1 MAG: SLC13 family permease [Acidobacteriota bacterium]REK15151.1 MAG: SLC13 family permease [Acidobacteriota bacterium]REK46241.1 MAG: SLC13 family permease [Acidobacteriota bacterium]